MSLATPRRENWTRLNVTLHWLILLLIVAQFASHWGMEDYWRALHGRGDPAAPAGPAYAHVAGGAAVLLFTLLRIWDRLYRGRPPYPARTPGWAHLLSRAVHGLIFAILIAMPAIGMAAWISNSGQLGRLHGVLWLPLLALVAIHVTGALAEHFVFRTNVLKRMLGMRDPAATV